MPIVEREFFRKRVQYGNAEFWQIRVDTDQGNISVRQFRTRDNGFDVECINHFSLTEFRTKFKHYKIQRPFDEFIRKLAAAIPMPPAHPSSLANKLLFSPSRSSSPDHLENRKTRKSNGSR